MKYQTNSKPSVRRHEHESMRDMAAAANQMNTILMAKARVYVASHLDAPRTASSQCLLDDGDIAATVTDAIECITTVPDGALKVGVNNGWVTLRGKLDSWAARETVEHVALHSVGVRGIVNSITVEEKPLCVL
ncbi:MAG TPA: BON domain-containing protein [Verrucomicrobiae bacterium]|nr:BON domain-containing protein [Verrucomicrobiae bacterium]